jgi:hypothetical protein
MGVKNRVGTGLSYRSARLNRLVESIAWNRFVIPELVFVVVLRGEKSIPGID